MKNKAKEIIKTITLTIVSIAIGFMAMTAPFDIFTSLTPNQIKALFLSEIIIYTILFSAFFLIKEKKQAIKAQKHKQKIEKQKRRDQLLKDLEQFNMAA